MALRPRGAGFSDSCAVRLDRYRSLTVTSTGWDVARLPGV
jgi:hypothetical protein